MWREAAGLAMVSALAACAAGSGPAPDYAAKNRPLEERCLTAHPQRSNSRPDMTRADVEAEARAAERRGELDKACAWL
ncbi:MAG: DUF4148 domain-containing protein [Rhizobacter sp.]